MLEDSPGGWCRLKLKLGLSGLVVANVICPQPSFMQPHLVEFVASLQAHGIDLSTIPSGPVSYAQLIHNLSVLGLLSV